MTRRPTVVALLCLALCTAAVEPLNAQSPRAVVSAGEVVDTVALATRLFELGQSVSPDSGSILLWIIYPPRGKEPAVVTTVHSRLSRPLTDSIASAVRAASLPEAQRKGAVLEIRMRPAVTVVARDVKGEAPRLMNGRAVAEQLARRARDAERLGNGIVRMRVDIDGRPDSVWISHSSGTGSLDRMLLDVARTARFKPGTIEGFPVPMFVEQPLQFRY